MNSTRILRQGQQRLSEKYQTVKMRILQIIETTIITIIRLGIILSLYRGPHPRFGLSPYFPDDARLFFLDFLSSLLNSSAEPNPTLTLVFAAPARTLVVFWTVVVLSILNIILFVYQGYRKFEDLKINSKPSRAEYTSQRNDGNRRGAAASQRQRPSAQPIRWWQDHWKIEVADRDYSARWPERL